VYWIVQTREDVTNWRT